MAGLNDKQFDRLTKAVDWSSRALQFARKKRIEAIKEYVGAHYSSDGADRRVPVNMLALSVLIYTRQLAARAPRVMVTTKRRDLEPVAANLELAINQIPDEIGLGATLRRMVMEALFSFGIVKVGLHTVGTALGHDYGETFVDLVTPDDYFVDMAAQHYDMIDFEGNDYWLDYDEVMESNDIDKRARDGLQPDEFTLIGENGQDRAESIVNESTPVVFKKKILLRDAWLPSEGLLIRYAVKSKKKLATIEWDGPEKGPYFRLGYADVPSNLLPLPPIALWRDLHELSNSLFRKLGKQADGQKSVLGFQGGNEESILAFKSAEDGDGIRYTGTEPKKLQAGGVDAKTLAFYMQCRDLSSYFAGNLDSLGGLAPLTETVGQDKLIGEAASAQLRDMTSTTVDVVRDIFKAIAYYEWNDPIKRRQLEKPIPGTDMKIAVDWGRESKKGDISNYDLDIDVYSMHDDSPSMKLQKLGLVMQQYVLPLAPLIQQQGGQIDVQAILRDVARFSDMQEVNSYVTFTDQPIEAQAGAGAPEHTSREYIRRGSPGMTRQGASTQMQQELMSMGGEE